MKRLLLIMMLPLLALGGAAKKQAVGPSRLHKPAVEKSDCDTVVPQPGLIVCSGYDKPNRATRETFFLTNHTADTLTAVNLTLTYRDLSDRQLHSSTHTVRVQLPPGQTRNVGVPSWDRNNAFHYELSPAPKRRQSSPYRVSAQVNYVIIRSAIRSQSQ